MSDKRVEVIQIRVNRKEKNMIRGLAGLYAGGDLSMWLRYAGLNAERKFLLETKKAPSPKTRGPKRSNRTTS